LSRIRDFCDQGSQRDLRDLVANPNHPSAVEHLLGGAFGPFARDASSLLFLLVCLLACLHFRLIAFVSLYLLGFLSAW